MANNQIHIYLFLYLTGLLIYGCEEPIELNIENPESILVVEATITDELKNQVINLSRTYPAKIDSITNIPPETNAEVKVVDDANNEYAFEETEAGTYKSIEEFQAKPNREYQLKIITNNGEHYVSEPAQLVTGSKIDRLYGERTIYNGKDGVALFIDNANPNNGSSNFYKYEFKETFKIVSPFHSDTTFFNRTLEIRINTRNERICYKTQPSTEIILANTKKLSENTLEEFLLRFIESKSPILSFRYTILANQFAISQQTYNYYATLKEFSKSGGLFSQVQPGFINGNIASQENLEEKVIGIFSISSVSSKRIYLERSDFYKNEDEKPAFAKNCKIIRPALSVLRPMINNDAVRFYGIAPMPHLINGLLYPYYVVPTPCIDCRVFGSNVKPDFWVEEI